MVLACIGRCWNGSYSWYGLVCFGYNVRGSLWELSIGDKDRNYFVYRMWGSVLFVGYIVGKFLFG